MRCLSKRGWESWNRAEQKTLYKKEFPPRVGGGNLRQNGNAMTRAERVGAPIEIVKYHFNCINIIVELDVATVARFVLFFTVFSQRTCLKPWF